MSDITSTSSNAIAKFPEKYCKEIFSKLLQPALKVQKNAYCPYSKFHVGCALLAGMDSGISNNAPLNSANVEDSIFVGCNFENQSFGLTICAERCAIGNMLSELGPNSHIKYVVVVTPNGCACCGACLQVLAEFVENGDTPVILLQRAPDTETDEQYIIKEELCFRELLPKAINIKDIVQ